VKIAKYEYMEEKLAIWMGQLNATYGTSTDEIIK
jgi:hypothetical protein